MKVKEISLSLGRTINTGNYNSARVEFSSTYELSLEDDLEEIYTILLLDTKSGLSRAVKEMKFSPQATKKGQNDE